MTTRRITNDDIRRTVKELCIKANTVLRPDVLEVLKKGADEEEKGSVSEKMMRILIENAAMAEKETMPICQDTGLVSVFLEIGEDVSIEGKGLKDAINKGVEEAYKDTFLRKSVVADPILRDNTGTNTPAIINLDIVKGDKLTIWVMPKGFGSENKGSICMMNPTCTEEDIVKFCTDTVKKAGSDACPPYILGIGLGGTMDTCASLAKKALLEPVGGKNKKPHIADMERRIREEVSNLGIGIMGLGGKSTVLGVRIKESPTHIAGLPVAVNLSCHALRSACAEL
ncbi:MAG: fumarate hydratase [Candidatus Aadella gelida]|nr:fumarate hydratase [Candidatus Aadella gelida]